MIERIYIKDYLSFEEIELNLGIGLIVFTGASGSGKSILMDAILSIFALSEAKAKISEASLNIELKLEDFEIEESVTFRCIKKEKVRYFLNEQVASKNRIKEISSTFIKHLNLKDLSDFDNENILNIIDSAIEDIEFKTILDEFRNKFQEYNNLKKELNEIDKNYKEMLQLRDFLEFEVDKIESINPSINEYDELLEQKRHLSKREKISDALNKARGIFEFERIVDEALSLADEDSNFFSDCMNELRNSFEIIKDKINELEHIDIEVLLHRLEALSNLNRKYGSIKDALKYKNEKKEELKKYENLESNRDELDKKLTHIQENLKKLSTQISKYRMENLAIIENRLNYYLKMLYLKDAKIELKEAKLNKLGSNTIAISLDRVSLENISFGEFNRLRLALLATKSEFDNSNIGILILDEIDANLSGKESQSIGKVLNYLSKNYQIFSISHQPQLTSSANQHFLVEKIDNKSSVKEVDSQSRVNEIARMISGDKITNEALEFAKKMIYENR